NARNSFGKNQGLSCLRKFINSVIDLVSQCIFNLIELRISSNTDNIFPIKIIDNSSDSIRQSITFFDNLFSKDRTHQ
ncbi:hypothetical protein VQW72_07615, partial [Helicobacter pylori]